MFSGDKTFDDTPGGSMAEPEEPEEPEDEVPGDISNDEDGVVFNQFLLETEEEPVLPEPSNQKDQDLLERLIGNMAKDDERINEAERAEKVLKRNSAASHFLDEEEEEDRRKKKAEELRKKDREKRKKRIRNSAPGLNLFKEEDFLKHFKAETLDIEADFGYQGRQKLIKLGMPEADLEEIFSCPSMFMLYLAPEASSALISDPSDFKVICDYLFFCSSSTPNNELFKKSLFDLLKNYNYRWQLRDAHVHLAMINLGFKEEIITDPAYLQEVFMDARKKNVMAPKLNPKLKAKSGQRSSSSAMDYDLIKDFVKLICDLLVSHPIRRDEMQNLMLVHSLLLICSDQHLINDSFVHNDLIHCFHFQFNDMFDPHQWRKSGLDDLTELFAFLFNPDKMGVNWDSDQVPGLGHFGQMDHHHNLLRRLAFIPPSLRGTQLKKQLALLHLQEILNHPLEAVRNPSAIHVRDLLRERNSGALFGALGLSEYYCTFTLIKLIDIVVGNEKADFEDEKCAALNDILEKLNPLEKVKASLMTDDCLMDEKTRIGELISQFKSKWTMLKNRYND